MTYVRGNTSISNNELMQTRAMPNKWCDKTHTPTNGNDSLQNTLVIKITAKFLLRVKL